MGKKVKEDLKVFRVKYNMEEPPTHGREWNPERNILVVGTSMAQVVKTYPEAHHIETIQCDGVVIIVGGCEHVQELPE